MAKNDIPDGEILFPDPDNARGPLGVAAERAVKNYCAAKITQPPITAAQARHACEWQTFVYNTANLSFEGEPICTFTPSTACVPNRQAQDWCWGLPEGTCKFTQLCEWDSGYANPLVTQN